MSRKKKYLKPVFIKVLSFIKYKLIDFGSIRGWEDHVSYVFLRNFFYL